MFPLGGAKYVIMICTIGIVRTLTQLREEINEYKNKDDQ